MHLMSKKYENEDMEEHVRILRGWMKGDAHATAFCVQFLQMVHTWDDLVDGDNEATEKSVNDAFYWGIGEWRHNPFYARWYNELMPIITSAVHDWYTSNELERDGSEHDLAIAFSLKVNVLSVITHCAYLVGGTDWVKKVGPEIRRFGQRETLEEYVREHKCPK